MSFDSQSHCQYYRQQNLCHLLTLLFLFASLYHDNAGNLTALFIWLEVRIIEEYLHFSIAPFLEPSPGDWPAITLSKGIHGFAVDSSFQV